VYYYSALLFLYMILYNVCGSNISTHLAQAGARSTAVAGIAVAVQMAGGACSGLLFGRLSAKLGDMLMPLAVLALFLGLMILGVFPGSVPAAFIAVFIAGSSLSWIAPRALFAVSTLVDETNSAAASAVANSVAPSLGGFISPYIFTRVTLRLFGEATGPRYLFTAGAALLFAAMIALATRARRRRGLTDLGDIAS
jgi:MFS family permease